MLATPPITGRFGTPHHLFGKQGAAVACCAVQTPITALLARDVASSDWWSPLSDRFVMNGNADQYRLEARKKASLSFRERVNL